MIQDDGKTLTPYSRNAMTPKKSRAILTASDMSKREQSTEEGTLKSTE